MWFWWEDEGPASDVGLMGSNDPGVWWEVGGDDFS